MSEEPTADEVLAAIRAILSDGKLLPAEAIAVRAERQRIVEALRQEAAKWPSHGDDVYSVGRHDALRAFADRLEKGE